jgi:hypothetical protein
MKMRIIGCLLVTGILLSYVPIIPLDDCPGANHMGNIMRMDCGSPFHCPMIVDLNISETSGLPLNGRLVSIKPLLVVKELVHSVYHPPEYLTQNLIPMGMKGNNSTRDLGMRIAD